MAGYLLFLLGFLLLPTVSSAAPIEMKAPWSKDQIWVAGNGCGAGGSYYDQDYHKGKNLYSVDFNGKFDQDCQNIGTDDGEAILAVSGATVVDIGRNSGSTYGYYVLLDHGNDVTTRYAHLKFDPTINPGLKVGDKVEQGQIIGRNGNTGASTSSHLHFTLYQSGVSVRPDPIDGISLCDACNGAQVKSTNYLNQPPSAPTLSWPPNGWVVHDRTINFSWNNALDLDNDSLNYSLRVYDQLTGAKILDTPWNSATSYSYTFSNSVKNIIWQVAVGDGKDHITNSDQWLFLLNGVPNSPTNLQPTANAVIRDRTVNFSWGDGGDDNLPRPYRDFVVKIYNQSGQFVAESGWITQKNWSYTLPTLGDWQWQVCSGDSVLVSCSERQWIKLRQKIPNDFNGDGQSDELAHNKTTGIVRLDTYNSQIYPQNRWQTQWDGKWQHHIGYFNSDRFADKLSYVPSTGEVALMTSDDQAVLRTAWVGTWNQDWNIIVGNFNGDTRDDIFVYNPVLGNVELALSNSDGTFSVAWRATWGSDWELYAGDFNGDGTSDLLTYKSATGAARQHIFDYNGNLTFTWGTIWDAGWKFYLGDYNDDGFVDLLAYNPANGNASMGASNRDRNATFTGYHPPYWPTTWSSGWSIITGNFNGQGADDALFYNPTTGQSAMDIFRTNSRYGWFDTAWGSTWSSGWSFNR